MQLRAPIVVAVPTFFLQRLIDEHCRYEIPILLTITDLSPILLVETGNIIISHPPILDLNYIL